jgi:hypothetical protein
LATKPEGLAGKKQETRFSMHKKTRPAT